MPRHIAFLRGVNVSGHRRVPMGELRAALEAAGSVDVATYVQSGNVVLTVPEGERPAGTAARVEAVLASGFGLDDVPVLVRTAAELHGLIAANPFATIADDPARHHVLLLGEALDEAALAGLPVLPPDAVAPSASGRELHLWTPNGIGRSKLAVQLTDRRLGTTVTARNWRTVTRLAAMA